MLNLKKKITILALTLFFLASSGIYFASAQTATPAPTGATASDSEKLKALHEKIADLESKLSATRSQKSSLTSQIDVMDNQIQLTEYRINATQQEITDIALDIDATSKRMSTLESSLSDVSKVLLNRIVATYQVGGTAHMQAILTSKDISELMSRANYLRIVQEHDKKLLYDAQQARNDYANQKQIFEGKKKKIETLKGQLEGYTAQLDKDKIEKEKLLTVTKNDESKYQAMLDQAKAQISSFKTFATSQGGSVLPPQASPDGWYFNQRDERWGRNNIGSSSESVWQVGCLVTSTAMLRKHRGENITPADVAGQSSFFFANTAMMLIPWNGGRFSSGGNSTSAIDAKLASGPIIVGLNAGPYGTHFIVLKSGSGGSYIMNDPWNGPDLNFGDYYSTGQIFQYGYLN